MSEPMQVGDAEAFVIGSVLAGYPDVDALLANLEPADFYQPLHEEIWTAIGRVHRAGNRPEPVSVRLALTAASVRFDPSRLFELMQATPLVASAPYYAEQVALASGMRQIQQAGIKVTQLGGIVGAELDDMREQARATIDAATRGKSTTSARSLIDIIPAVIDVAEKGQSMTLTTDWPDLDRIMGGLAPGRLVVVGARPGVGKSIMGTNLAIHVANVHGHAALISSMEMPESEVGQRMLAAYANANLTSLQHGTVDERTWARIADRLAQLSALPIVVDDAPGQTVTSIRRRAREVQRTRDDLALIVVDYLQLIRPSDPGMGRVEAIGEITRGLKLLARESGACVVAMAQVNREGVKTGDGVPRMSDLRESGSIEADADQVILLHQRDEMIPEVDVIVDKNRHGPRGVAKLQIQGHYAKFSSIETRRENYGQTS